jgi:hypothetical protein
MKIFFYALLMLILTTTVPAFATVVVSSPSNGESVNSSVKFVANGNTSTCSKGVSSMGIYVDNKLDYQANGTSLNTTLQLSSGAHRAVVQEWDYCGGATTTTINLTVTNQAGVVVTSPANGSTVSSPAAFVALGNTSCAKGVAAMGIYVNNNLVNKTPGAKLNTQVSMAAGNQTAVVQEWDNCGGASKAPVSVKVSGGSSSGGSSGGSGKTIANVQALSGWNQWGELPPNYGICSPCNGVTWSMNQHNSAVSLDGNSTKFYLGGSRPYGDVLFSNPVIGQGNTNGLTDSDHKLIPTLHNFTLDQYVYITNLSVTQDLEFDINMYENGVGMEWGTQCNHLADGDWDLWNNVTGHWFSSGVPCQLNNNAWNRVTLQMQRESNNDLLYQSISVNGVTHTINQTVAPFHVPGGWWGMTINYQMDGNSKQTANTTYLDKMNFTYW